MEASPFAPSVRFSFVRRISINPLEGAGSRESRADLGNGLGRGCGTKRCRCKTPRDTYIPPLPLDASTSRSEAWSEAYENPQQVKHVGPPTHASIDNGTGCKQHPNARGCLFGRARVTTSRRYDGPPARGTKWQSPNPATAPSARQVNGDGNTPTGQQHQLQTTHPAHQRIVILLLPFPALGHSGFHPEPVPPFHPAS